MVRAYVFLETNVGSGPAVADTLRSLPEVRLVYRVTGPHDVIATVETRDMAALSRLVEGKIGGVPGIDRTITCIVMPR
jgi:DNA-binding Lrp family transcriptional regulator